MGDAVEDTGARVGPMLGLPVFARSSAWTSMPDGIRCQQWTEGRVFHFEYKGTWRTFLEQDPLKKRILVAEHKAFVGGIAVAVLEVLQRLFMMLDGAL